MRESRLRSGGTPEIVSDCIETLRKTSHPGRVQTMKESRHTELMRHAVEVAQANPAAPFGTVLVDRHAGKIVATGVNRTGENPSWHGEIDAINQFAGADSSVAWTDLDLYTTAEPCPMCQAAILWCGIPRVIFGTSIEELTQLGWNQIDLSAASLTELAPFADCEIVGGVLREECRNLFETARADKKRPSRDA